MEGEPRVRKATANDYPRIIELLTESDLPLAGLTGADDFVVLSRKDKIIGCAAVERYDDYGLLRSVAIAEPERGRGLGVKLVEEVLERAQQDGISEIILFTKSASTFFEETGFRMIEREQVPLSVQTSLEFQTVCSKSQAMSITL